MKKYIKIFIIIVLSAFVFLPSCMKDDMRPITEFNSSDNGVLITCEGNFMYGNASLSYYNKNTKTIENSVFLRANGIPLGDVAQSICLYNNLAWIVVNNSGKIVAIDPNTFKIKGQITGLVSPRYILFINPQKAYVSDLYSKTITVINPSTFKIIKEISIDDNSGEYYRHSSEQLAIIDNKLYTNSWSFDDKILVIDITKDSIVKKIQTLKQPRKIVVDKNKNIWVLCDGGTQGSNYFGNAGIIKINSINDVIENQYLLPENSYPTDMKINSNGDTIYFINKHVYRFNINNEPDLINPIINSENKNFYSIGIDPYNSDIYVSDVIDYLQSGVVYRYSANLICKDTVKTGIVPGCFDFN